MRTLAVLLVIISLLLGASCKKDAGLTKESQNGANTFSCKINGKVFLPKTNLSDDDLYAIVTGPSGSRKLAIGATNSDERKNINIIIIGFSGVGTYQLNSDKGIYVDYWLSPPSVPVNKNYTTKNSNIGKIIITRSDNNIVSGTFEFTCLNEKDSNDRAVFTSGRFDLIVD